MLIAVQVQILAWDIINEPANPGDTSGDVLFVSHCLLLCSCQPALMHSGLPHMLHLTLPLTKCTGCCSSGRVACSKLTAVWGLLQDWLSSTSAYVKSIDSNHLVYYGTPGYFGSSTPDL